MRTRRLLTIALAAGLLHAPVLSAQMPGTLAHPDVYQWQFENDWVRLIRVNVPAGANLSEHSHPAGTMVHLYLNDADPIVFEHPGLPGTVTRPRVAARSYRIGRAKPETHAVINRGRGASDYMRIELKTIGDVAQGQRVPAPPLGATTRSVVEITNAQYRATRITIAAGQTFEVVAGATEPALLVAVTEGVVVESVGTTAQALTLGQERFVDVGRRDLVRNSGDATVELLRIDFLTRPATRDASPE